MKQFFILPIRAYQIVTGLLKRGGFVKDTCVFYPTCSVYAILAIQKYGAIKGMGRAIKRVARCHPWQEPQVDEV